MKILIIDTVHEILIEKLEKSGFFCDYVPDLTADEVEKKIHEYDGVIGRSKIPFQKALLDKAIRLKFIGRVGAGVENIDLAYAGSKGIKCFNSPEGNRDAVGEHTLGMLLNLLNKINIADSEVRNFKWKREANRGIEIKGKTVGIIGYGNMGSAFAQRLCGFETRVIAYDKYKFDYSNQYVTETSLENLFELSDIVSLHVPLTAETNYMVNNEFINSFTKNIFILNTSRGKVVKTDDLVQNIKSGKILGAALDVLEYENATFENLSSEEIPDSLQFLLSDKHCLLTPHIAGWTQESKFKLADNLADKIIVAFENYGS